MKRILFTGGGTGGHIFPIIAIVEEMRKRGSDFKLEYIGPSDFTSKTFLPQAKINAYYISSGKLRRYFSIKSVFSNIFDLLIGIPFGIFQAFIIMFFIAPDVIVSKGGFGSVPAIIAGWILRIPIFMHESDVVGGLANKIGGKLSEKIFVSFPTSEIEDFPKEKLIESGNPVRSILALGNKEDAKIKFNLTGEKPVILILGGSQGSEKINEVILGVLVDVLQAFEIIHQTGMAGFKRVKNESLAMIDEGLLKYYHPYFFLDDRELALAYTISECVVARSGAGTIFEIALLKKPSILIPLPGSAQNHQVRNAYSYARNGACLVLEEGNFTPHFFFEKLKEVVKEDKESMSKAAELFSKPYAAVIIARYVLDFIE